MSETFIIYKDIYIKLHCIVNEHTPRYTRIILITCFAIIKTNLDLARKATKTAEKRPNTIAFLIINCSRLLFCGIYQKTNTLLYNYCVNKPNVAIFFRITILLNIEISSF